MMDAVSKAAANPVVHLELHTSDGRRARAILAELCGWRSERIETGGGAYDALRLGGCLGGGVVECGTPRPLWLPYAEVGEINAATEHARRLGATILLSAREGPTGWRSVVTTPQAGEIAFWQPKDSGAGAGVERR
jgi:predicted enzyme related to lactoylglutathione lyase